MGIVDRISAEIRQVSGLRADSGWQAAIEEALRETGHTESDLATWSLESRSRLISAVARRITVPETHFFRNEAQLAFISEHAARTAADEQRQAHIWVAGSATGEEPYTLAMLVQRRGGTGALASVGIAASDLNPEAVEKARRAVYTTWSFRGAPSWCYQNFQADELGKLQLTNAGIRGAVEFHVESCQAGALRHAGGSLDVVSFRNVAIYLEERAIDELHREFARILRPGGLLALGPSDPRPRSKAFEFLGYFDHAPVFVHVGPLPDSTGARARRSLLPTLPPLSAQVTRSSLLPNAVIVPTVAPLPADLLAKVAPAAPPRTPASRTPRRSPDLDASVSVLATVVEGAPEDPTGRRLLGQAQLERGEADAAVDTLRQAVFLDGNDPLTRYFYALALSESGNVPMARRQLTNVLSTLDKLTAEHVLSDGTTKVVELARSARYLERQWS